MVTEREVVIAVPRVGGIRIWRAWNGQSWEVFVADQQGNIRSKGIPGSGTMTEAVEAMAEAARKYVGEVA